MAVEGYKRLSMRLFGRLAEGSEKGFESLGPHLRGAGMYMLLKAYVAMVYMSTAVAYLSALAITLLVSMLLVEDFVMLVYYVMFIPVLAASIVFMVMYIYPSHRSRNVAKSIDNNLPFALIHMDSIASSGIPTEHMFELLGSLREYGEISRQAGLVVRNIKTLGMSSVSAINDVAGRTPSPAFKQVLTGISSTVTKGGNLTGFLREMSEKNLFEYRLRREKYVKTLSTFADIYTAVMIAAPLMMLSVLVMMNIIGGDIMGMTIPGMISLMTYVIVPLMNVAFLAFIHMSYPGG
jgi:flagellar protein FlaJ